MNKIILMIMFTVLSVVSMMAQPAGYTAIKDTAALNRKISEAARKTKTIESDFIQEKNLSVISEKIISKGHFTFKQENKLRWEYKEPFSYLVVMNNGKIFIKDNNKENKFDMQSNKMFQEINNLIVNSVQGKINDTKNFKAKAYENSEYYLVSLVPLSKNIKEFFSGIEVYFDKKDNTVGKINMVENSGDNTLIIFQNKKLNLEVSDEKFSFR